LFARHPWSGSRTLKDKDREAMLIHGGRFVANVCFILASLFLFHGCLEQIE